jgi:ketosteroid isomerase-like protein
VAEVHSNASFIRRVYEAFESGDLEFVNQAFADDCVWHFPGKSPLAGDYAGRAAIMRDFLIRLPAVTGGTFRATTSDVLANDRYAVALQHATAERNGKRLDTTACQLFRIVDGRIVEVRGHYADQYALDEFFS